MFSLPYKLAFAGIALAGLVLAGLWIANRIEQNGYDRRVAEEAAASKKAELERRNDDAALKRMSDFDLCVAGLRGNGMPVDPCEQLRGVREE